MTRIPIRYGFWRWLLCSVGAPPKNAYVEISAGDVRVRMGWVFRTRFPRALVAATNQVAEALEKAGFEVVVDDRDERAGVKFKDADLVGIPLRVNVGKKVSEGKVEVVNRSTREMQDATIAEIASHFERLTRPAA